MFSLHHVYHNYQLSGYSLVLYWASYLENSRILLIGRRGRGPGVCDILRLELAYRNFYLEKRILSNNVETVLLYYNTDSVL